MRLHGLPASFAVVGASLRVRTPELTGWEEWTVDAVYGFRDDEPDVHSAVRAHEKNTGDSKCRRE